MNVTHYDTGLYIFLKLYFFETYCNFISATIKRTKTMYPNIIYNTGKRKRHAETWS